MWQRKCAHSIIVYYEFQSPYWWSSISLHFQYFYLQLNVFCIVFYAVIWNAMWSYIQRCPILQIIFNDNVHISLKCFIYLLRPCMVLHCMTSRTSFYRSPFLHKKSCCIICTALHDMDTGHQNQYILNIIETDCTHTTVFEWFCFEFVDRKSI